MKQSEQIDQLATALSELQSRMRTVDKSASNPFFKSKYTPLEDVVDSIRPHLLELGLSFSQGGTLYDAWDQKGDGLRMASRLVLATRIMHKSGQWLENYFPLDAMPDKNGAVTPQAWGSASSYARRYGLQAALGITTGDVDDDGNLASGNEAVAMPREAAMPRASAPAPVGDSVRTNDWAALWAVADAKGMRKQVEPLRTKGFAAVAEALGLKVV
jgi:hypothetical protein